MSHDSFLQGIMLHVSSVHT